MNATVKKGMHFTIGLIILAVMLFPLYWIVIVSLETPDQIFRNPPYLIPPTPTLESYVSAFSTQLPHLLTSLVIALGVTFLSMIIAVPAAYATTHFKFKGTTIFIIALLISQMIPGVSLANGLFMIYQKTGLLDSYLGLILADCTFSIPFDILILRAFMNSIPKELPEAALVDGAGDWRTFISIILPISKSALITASLFAFLFGWGDFLFAVTLSTKGSITPITVSIYGYITQYSQSWGEMMATSVLASIPAAILLVISQRYVSAGLTSGSVKG
ncbi:carbohydrate ABC transporter permease [Halobacillus salinarum]|uniref:Carbohydrate ABC transporter permease n=1 Tax=Halobacillus salinarum TaxID=2932257 RepID=A0ABY4EN68_9BACI|nr:carbohydrate ABC transporter permease [Halobacillus salinarum]UOQ45425.1 carbohydrate ABC transporter permease [Halobacillus salinarum]